MRTFVALRKWMQSNKDLENKIHQLEGKYDQQFKMVFEAIRQLLREDNKEPRPIGFKISSEGVSVVRSKVESRRSKVSGGGGSTVQGSHR